MDFVALDFEIANERMSSICQVGIADFKNSFLRETYSSLINPEDYFSGINISIHGIEENDVVNAPTFPEVYPTICRFLSGRIVVSHTPFDRGALQQSIARYNLPSIDCRWLDSARVVRRTWIEYAKVGYGLRTTAERLGIMFNHHDALADAKVAGTILLHALSVSGIGVEDWLSKSLLPITGSHSLYREGNPSGSLYGEYLVFTGALSIPRREAANLAARIGCTVVNSVSKKVSILVVGDQDIQRVDSISGKSSKHRLAEKFLLEGLKIRIICEADFAALCRSENV